MIKISIHTLALFTLLIGAKIVSAQKFFDVKIQLPIYMESNKFIIKYDDGVNTYTVLDSFVNNRLEFKGEFASEYATIHIKYTENKSVSYENDYFIGTKTAEFKFSDSSILNKNPFENCKITNAIEVNSSDWVISRREYSREAIDAMNAFMDTNAGFLGIDSVEQKFYSNLNNVNKKDIEFIKRNKNLYFSFWWFRTQIVPNTLVIYRKDSIEIQKLLSIFDTVFPKKITEKPEGQQLRNLLVGRLLVQENTIAPLFEAKDIRGNIVTLKDYNGKYVLLDFWATWCPPCMKQIPFLKQLRNEYPSGKLVMISISADIDSSSFDRVIKKNEMNWIHIYDSKILPTIYGISAYPILILINTEGTIIYDGKNEDKKSLIELLKKM
jgi:thiol-disulfide isomerase/thioredoxin